MNEGKRSNATPLWIGDVLEGKFNPQNQPFISQEFCLQDGRMIEKVAICGIVVENQSLDENPFLLIDDGSGVISIRAFEMPEPVHAITPGCIVKVFGRPKLSMNIVYIFADIIKKIPDILWLEVWKKTVFRVQTITTPLPPPIHEKNTDSEEKMNEKIITFIREKDKNEGVELERIIQESNIPDCETKIAELLLKGRIFEVKPGIVKVLE